MALSESDIKLIPEIWRWWLRQRELRAITRVRRLLGIGWEFLRDFLPSQRRQRYGDVDYDWEHRVDTTSATVTWRSRLIGLLNSPYQPIPPEQFREMMAALAIDFSRFTFIDIGSGKGRALLLASEYGFRRIIGVELLPELDRIARRNVGKFRRDGKDGIVELICLDATKFVFPAEPTVIFLFNPLPETSLRRVMKTIENSLRACPRPLYVAYANPVLDEIVASCPLLNRFAGSAQFALFCSPGFSVSESGNSAMG